MSESTQSILNQALTKILRPLVRVLLRNGVACGVAEELLRKAFVDEAYTLSKSQNKKTTVSSISAETGLSRKEVKRLNELNGGAKNDKNKKYNRSTRVISGWLNDRKYSYDEGNPKPLSNDESDGSFGSLVKKFSGDIPTRTMLDLLKASGCIEILDDKVVLVRNAYVPDNDSEEIIRILGNDTNELIKTIDHNMLCTAEEKRFQRKVSSSKIPADAVSEFNKLSRDKSQALLEDLDTWLAKNSTKTGEGTGKYVSLGVYFYTGEAETETKND